MTTDLIKAGEASFQSFECEDAKKESYSKSKNYRSKKEGRGKLMKNQEKVLDERINSVYQDFFQSFSIINIVWWTQEFFVE